MLANWFIKNKLSLNLKKCKHMLFGTTHQLGNIGNLKIEYGNTSIVRVTSFKYLGVVLDSRLTFSDHVCHLKSKTYSKIKLPRRVRNILNQGTALTMYKTLILPIFDYCDFIYDRISLYDQETLQKLQNCAFKTILRVDRLTSANFIHEALNLDTLASR